MDFRFRFRSTVRSGLSTREQFWIFLNPNQNINIMYNLYSSVLNNADNIFKTDCTIKPTLTTDPLPISVMSILRGY